MKLVFPTLYFLLFTSIAYAQDSVVRWEGFASKKANGVFQLTVNGNIKANWHLYAKSDIAEGLEAVNIKWEHDSISRKEPIIIQDIIFNKKESVYTNTVSFQ